MQLAVFLLVLTNLTVSATALQKTVVKAATRVAYGLPWASGARHSVLQGNYRLNAVGACTSGCGTHRDSFMHFAWDFDFSEGTPVLAARGGKVAWVPHKLWPANHCGGQNLGNEANYVVVDHGDGTFALYLHLSKVTVTQGDTVKQGQEVGLSGKTGWTGCKPHLHFQVQGSGIWYERSIPAEFEDADVVAQNPDRVPAEGRAYIAGLGKPIAAEATYILPDIIVSARQGWHPTSLIVSRGQQLSVSAKGSWTVDYRYFRYVGPEGYSPEEDRLIYQGCKLDPQLPYGTLLARIGNSPYFWIIGRGRTFTADSSGVLSFRIHDTCLLDNSGSVRVAVTAAGLSTTPGAPAQITTRDQITARAKPIAPSRLTATPNSTSIRLSWKDNSNNETGFTIFNGVRRITVGADETSYTWTGLTLGKRMCFQVSSYNIFGSSVYTPDACATTPTKQELFVILLREMTNYVLAGDITEQGRRLSQQTICAFAIGYVIAMGYGPAYGIANYCRSNLPTATQPVPKTPAQQAILKRLKQLLK
jgi:murein DD-endopeptidase MepM/ murein hydrolase activator NlpD